MHDSHVRECPQCVRGVRLVSDRLQVLGEARVSTDVRKLDVRKCPPCTSTLETPHAFADTRAADNRSIAD